MRAAAESEIPLVSAVGHETDWTLIDHAADLRAPTPTAAAELSVPVRAELLATLADLGGRIAGAALRLAERRRAELRSLARALPSGEAILAAPRQRLDAARAALHARARAGFDARALALAHLSRRLARQSPQARLAGLAERRRGLAQRLARAGASADRTTRRPPRRRGAPACRRGARRKPPRTGARAFARPDRRPTAPRAGRSAATARRTPGESRADVRGGQLYERAGARVHADARRGRRSDTPRERSRAASSAAHTIRRRRNRRDRRRPRGEPHARRGKPRSAKDDQGSLF